VFVVEFSRPGPSCSPSSCWESTFADARQTSRGHSGSPSPRGFVAALAALTGFSVGARGISRLPCIAISRFARLFPAAFRGCARAALFAGLRATSGRIGACASRSAVILSPGLAP
jgi:hypothetical protein